MTKSLERNITEIKIFSERVNRLLDETKEQPELIDSIRRGEWFEEVHEDRLLFSFRLPPHLQAIQREMYEIEVSKRSIPWFKRNDSEFIRLCSWKIVNLWIIFEILFDQEIRNVLNGSPGLKDKKNFWWYLCEGWTVKFIERFE